MYPMLDFTLIFQDERLHDKVKFLYWRRKIIYCGREKPATARGFPCTCLIYFTLTLMSPWILEG